MPAHTDSEWQQGMCPLCPKNTHPAATAQGPRCQSSGEKLGKNRPQPWAHGEAGWAQGHRWLREKSQPLPWPLPQPCAPLPSQHHCPTSPYPSPSVISAPLVPIPAPQALFRCQLCRFSSFHTSPCHPVKLLQVLMAGSLLWLQPSPTMSSITAVLPHSNNCYPSPTVTSAPAPQALFHCQLDVSTPAPHLPTADR